MLKIKSQLYKRNSAIPFILTIITTLILISCSEEENLPSSNQDDPEIVAKDSVTKVLISIMNKDSLKFMVTQLENFGTRFALAGNRKTIALSLEKRFKKIGLTDTRIDSFRIALLWQGQQYVEWHYNVSAHLHGRTSPDTLSIIGAHYDDIITSGNPFVAAPGANDNASGVAAVFEIARVMSAQNYKPAGSINFVLFAAEEFELTGSRIYAENAYNRRDRITIMLNLDMIAWEQGIQPVKWKLNIMNYANSLPLLEKARQYCLKYSFLMPVTDNKKSQFSDSYSFFNKGYRALYYTSPAEDPNYHTKDDISSGLNFDFCLEVVKASCAMIVYQN